MKDTVFYLVDFSFLSQVNISAHNVSHSKLSAFPTIGTPHLAQLAHRFILVRFSQSDSGLGSAMIG